MSFYAQSQELEPQEPEDSPAIFDTKLGDQDLELYARGMWKSRLVFGWGSGFTPWGPVPALGYPGLERGFVFQQIPDLNLSLWLMKRYYFEVTYQKTQSFFLLGYQGKNAEVLQWAKIGNAPMTIPSRASLLVPGGRLGNPGLELRFASPFSVHDLLVRYEDSRMEKKIFLGKQSFEDRRMDVDWWIKGQFFRLPAGILPVDGVKVLVQDPQGLYTLTNNTVLNGLRFRLSRPDEVYLDSERGEIRLFNPSAGVLLVSWTLAPASFTDPLSNQVVSSQSAVSSQKGYWYVLYQPGAYSAFELKDRYPLQKNNKEVEIQLVQKGTSTPLDGYILVTGRDQNWLTLTNPALPAFYPPFWDKYPGMYYEGSQDSPYPAAVSELFQEEILIRSKQDNLPFDLFLGPGVLPGSVKVVRNGVVVPVAHFHLQSGKIDLPGIIFPSDEIVVYYQSEKSFQEPTDFSIFQGNLFTINEKQSIETMGSFRWNLSPRRFTKSDMESPGQLQYAVEWKGSEGAWNWSTGLKADGFLTDSTGYRRLYGMDQPSLKASLDSSSVRPSAAPYELSSRSTGSSALGLDPTRRGATYYRDYWTSNALTGLPSLASGAKQGIPQETSGAGGFIGPYLVQGDETRTDRLVVLESLLNDNQWSGLHVYFDSGREKDLSSATEIQLALRLSEQLPPGTRVFFQAGSLGNDIDGTQTVLSKVISKWPGISLTDRHLGATVTYPIPEDSSWTNDTQGSFVIRPTGALITRELTQSGDLAMETVFSLTNTQWQNVIFTLSDDERNLLKDATGWRIVIVNQTSTNWSSARFLYASSAEFFGTSFGLAPASDSNNKISVHELPESRIQKKSNQSLSDSFEEIKNIFHPDGSEPKILEACWSSAPWEIQGRHNPLRFSSYRKLVLYYRLDSVSVGTPKISLVLSDANGKGLRADWQPQSNSQWSKLVIDLQDSRLLSQEIGSVQIDRSSGSWDRFRLTFDGMANGFLYLAEIHCEEPLWELRGAWTAQAAWYQQEPFPHAGFPLLWGAMVKTDSQLSFTSLGQTAWVGNSDIQFNLGSSRWTSVVSLVTEPGRQKLHGAYTVTLPIGPLELREQFSDLGSRSNGITLTAPYLGRLLVDARVYGPPMMLRQEYSSTWSDFLKPLILESWTLIFRHSWQQNWLEKIPLQPFGPQWLQSWSWYLFREGLPHFTQGQHETIFVIPPSPLGLQMNWQLQTAQTRGWIMSPLWLWEIAFPYKQQTRDGIWQFQQKFTRRLSLTDRHVQGYAPWDLCRISMERLISIPWGFLGLPFQEQFFTSHSLATQPGNLSTGSLESQSVTTLRRPRNLYWVDLVVPLQSDLIVQTRQMRENQSLLFFNKAQLKIFSQGLNQFGRSGVQPFFLWYETDEWSWSIDTSVSDGSKIEDEKWTLGLSTLGKVFFTSRESLSVPVKVDGIWSYKNNLTLEIGPVWELRLAANLPFDLPRWLSPKTFSCELIHRTTFNIRYFWDDEPDTPIFQKIYTEYQGILRFSQDGELALLIRWGNEWQKNLYLTGVELSLNFKLSY